MKDGGSIILNASIASSKGMQAMSVYSATKAAVRSFAALGPSISKNAKFASTPSAPALLLRPLSAKWALPQNNSSSLALKLWNKCRWAA